MDKVIESLNNQDYIRDQINTLSQVNLAGILHQHVGTTSLKNLGNTCYMNSILQCLRHTTPLNSILFTNTVNRTLSKNYELNPIIKSPMLVIVNYEKIVYMMWCNDNTNLSPVCFKYILGLIFNQFANFIQHDAHELLVTLLQSFHDSLSKNVVYRINGEIITELDIHIKKAHDDWIMFHKNKHSVILDIFSGQLRSELTCLNCHKTFNNFDPTMVIDLPVPSEGNIYQCFDYFILTEQLGDDNLYHCESCHSRTQAFKKTTLWKLPTVLIIKLDRFKYHNQNGSYASYKINYRIE